MPQRALGIVALYAVGLFGCDGSPVSEATDDEVPVEYSISVVSSPPEGGSTAGGGTYPEGETATVIASPAEGYGFMAWTENGSETATTTDYSFMVAEDRSLVANFAVQQHMLEVDVSGTGDGTVASDPAGIDCTLTKGETEGTCMAGFDHGTEVHLTANPASDHLFSGWTGACSGTGPCSLSMTENTSVTANFSIHGPGEGNVGFLAPEDFIQGRLSIHLPESPSGKTYIIGVPNVSSVDWQTRSAYVHSQEFSFTLDVASPSEGALTSLRPLPERYQPPLEEWTSPSVGAPTDLAAEREFFLWSQRNEEYVSATGALAFVGAEYAFYEDHANVENFTEAEYEELNGVLDDHFPRVRDLMGAPTDLDGNQRIVVFISSTMMDHRDFGEAYVDGCHLRVETPGCEDRGEFVYIASLDHFHPVENREFYVGNYYPRNIIHETVHLLQQGHAYRVAGTWAPFSIPAFYSEGQAELLSMETGLRREAIWNGVKYHFTQLDQMHRNPFFYPYDLGALFLWYLHQMFGDGLSQALIEAAFDPRKAEVDLMEIAIGIPEPLLIGMLYASVLFDGDDFGVESGLHFPADDVSAQLSGVTPPKLRLLPGESGSQERKYTGGAIFEVEHHGPIRLNLDLSPGAAYVVIVQPTER